MTFSHDRTLLFSRGDSDDPRLGDIVQMPTPSEFGKLKWDCAIIGFPDDRGVALNKGRVGAKKAPNAIRHWLYRLVPPFQNAKIADLGDMQMTDDLHHDHNEAAAAVIFALSHATRVLILAGGHDWGYAPIQALLSAGKTGFLNLDAHLDVRASLEHHSGTSYWRALETGVSGDNAIWYGVQRSAMSLAHEEFVYAKGGHLFCTDRMDMLDLAPLLGAVNSRVDALDISLDMDVFEMSAAPGVSAPQAAGITVEAGIELLSIALELSKVRTMGIYELSPEHDTNEMTARLAARCAWEAIRSCKP